MNFGRQLSNTAPQFWHWQLPAELKSSVWSGVFYGSVLVFLWLRNCELWTVAWLPLPCLHLHPPPRLRLCIVRAVLLFLLLFLLLLRLHLLQTSHNRQCVHIRAVKTALKWCSNIRSKKTTQVWTIQILIYLYIYLSKFFQDTSIPFLDKTLQSLCHQRYGSASCPCIWMKQVSSCTPLVVLQTKSLWRAVKNMSRDVAV